MARKITDQAANRIAALALELLDPHTGAQHPMIGTLLAEQVLRDLPASGGVKQNHADIKKAAGQRPSSG